MAVGVSCLDEPCTARATGAVNVPGAARLFRLRRASAQIGQGGKATLRLKVSRKALGAIRRALRGGRRVKARINVTTSDAAGNRTTSKRVVRLRL